MEAYKSKATAALVLGIISVALSFLSSFFYPAIAGLACGIIALVLGIQIKKAGQTEGFEVSGNAKAGYVLGIIGVILNAIMFVMCVVVLGAAGIFASQLGNYSNFIG